MPDMPFDGRRLLFVVGVMRSGTTILYRLLHQHPQITLMYETDVFALHPLLWPSWRKGQWIRRLDFWNRALTRHGITGEVLAALPSQIHGPGAAFEALGRAFEPHHAATYLGDKSIHYCGRLPELARAFPTASFVVLWRPLAEVLDSLHRAGQTNAYLAPARRRRQVFCAYEDLAEGVQTLRGLGRSVHEVTYRELVGDPENACRGLCGFLGLPWSPEMLANDPGNVSAIPDQEHHFHARNTQPGGVPARELKLPASLAAKVRSYEQLWAMTLARRGLTLPVRSTLPPGPAGRFFVFERWADRLADRIHRVLIFHKLLAYRFAPLAWLHVWRAFRRHGQLRDPGADAR